MNIFYHPQRQPHTGGYGALIIILLSAFVFLFWVFELPRIMLPGETTQAKAARLAGSSNLLAYVPLANQMSGDGYISGSIASPKDAAKIILTTPLATSAVSDKGIVIDAIQPIAVLIPNAQGSFFTQLKSGSYGIIIERKDGVLVCGTNKGYFSACTVSVSAKKTTTVRIP